MVDGNFLIVAIPAWFIGALIYAIVGAFIILRFMQYVGYPGIIDNTERPKPAAFIWFLVVVISLVMFLFWPGVLAVFFGYINE